MKNHKLRTFVAASTTLALLGACDITPGDLMMCDGGFEHSPTWPSNMEPEIYDPFYCPIEISFPNSQSRPASGWIWQNDPQNWLSSLAFITRPGGAAATEHQISEFISLWWEPPFRTRSSHALEYVPGGDSMNRCYDVVHYQLYQQAPNGQPYYVTWARTHITIKYIFNNPDCSGGGGGESPVSEEEVVRKLGIVPLRPYAAPAPKKK